MEAHVRFEKNGLNALEKGNHRLQRNTKREHLFTEIMNNEKEDASAEVVVKAKDVITSAKAVANAAKAVVDNVEKSVKKQVNIKRKATEAAMEEAAANHNLNLTDQFDMGHIHIGNTAGGRRTKRTTRRRTHRRRKTGNI